MGFFGYNKKLLQADPTAPEIFDFGGNKRNDLQKFMQWSAGKIYQDPVKALGISNPLYKENYWWKDNSTDSVNSDIFKNSLVKEEKNQFVSEVFTSNGIPSMRELIDDKNSGYMKMPIPNVFDGNPSFEHLIDVKTGLKYIADEYSNLANVRNTILSVLEFRNDSECFTEYYGVGIIKHNAFQYTINNAKDITISYNDSAKRIELSPTVQAEAVVSALNFLNNGIVKEMVQHTVISEENMERLNEAFASLLGAICENCPCVFTFPKVLPNQRTYKFVYRFNKFIGNGEISDTDIVKCYMKAKYKIPGGEKLSGQGQTCFNAVPKKGWIIGKVISNAHTKNDYAATQLNPDLNKDRIVWVGDVTKMDNTQKSKRVAPTDAAWTTDAGAGITKTKNQAWIFDPANSYDSTAETTTGTQTINLYAAGIPVKIRYFGIPGAYLYPSSWTGPDPNGGRVVEHNNSYYDIIYVVGEKAKIYNIKYNKNAPLDSDENNKSPLHWTNTAFIPSSEHKYSTFKGYAVKKSNNSPSLNTGSQEETISLNLNDSRYEIPSSGTDKDIRLFKLYPIFDFSFVYQKKKSISWAAYSSIEDIDTGAQNWVKGKYNVGTTAKGGDTGESDHNDSRKDPGKVIKEYVDSSKKTTTQWLTVDLAEDIPEIGAMSSEVRENILKKLKRINFVLTGWVNEEIHSHAPLVWGGYCRIYINDIKIGDYHPKTSELHFKRYEFTANKNFTVSNQFTPNYDKSGAPHAGAWNSHNAPNQDPTLVWTAVNMKSDSEDPHTPYSNADLTKHEPFCLFEYLGHKYLVNGNEWSERVYHTPAGLISFDTAMGKKSYDTVPKVWFYWQKNNDTETIKGDLKLQFSFLRKEGVCLSDSTKAGSIGMVYVGEVELIFEPAEPAG